MNIIKIKTAVENWLNSYPEDERLTALEDLASHGCESGMVGELIYYSDTTAFYERHCAEISALLVEALDNAGCKSPAELFGDKWDSTDPLALDVQNQNLLAWFGFEETAYRLLSEIEG